MTKPKRKTPPKAPLLHQGKELPWTTTTGDLLKRLILDKLDACQDQTELSRKSIEAASYADHTDLRTDNIEAELAQEPDPNRIPSILRDYAQLLGELQNANRGQRETHAALLAAKRRTKESCIALSHFRRMLVEPPPLFSLEDQEFTES